MRAKTRKYTYVQLQQGMSDQNEPFLHLQSERSSSTKKVKKTTKIFGQALLTKINSPKQPLKIILLYRIFTVT